jgi:transposase
MEPLVTEEIIARQTPEAQAIIRALLAEIAALKARIEELKRRGKGKTPQNSSLPPSTQHPHNRPQPRRRKSKKKRGGQPGHEKHERPLIPTDQCEEAVPLKPTECRRCGAKLSGSDPEPLRHQVWEVPEIKAHVTEYQRHRLTCPCCGETTCAELPPGVPQGQSGPHWMAFVALLMAYYRQSKRRTAEFLGMLLGQPCCPSLTVKIQNQVTAALRPSYEEAAAALPAEPQLKIDETGTKEEDGKAWLWTFLRHEGVEPTNNAGERSLRHAVIWRKLSFGTQSAAGSRFVETMLTVIETCRQQRRNVFAFVANAIEAHLAHQPAPSLLPRV